MMNGEIPSVPITTLAGISSLTDLLPEMPLPTPLPQTMSNKSLLFHPRVAEEAQILLSVHDENLVPQLIHSLVETSAEHIELKDHFASTDHPIEHQQNIPELLKAILLRNPNTFKGQQAQNAQDKASCLKMQPSQQMKAHHTNNFGQQAAFGAMDSVFANLMPHNQPSKMVNNIGTLPPLEQCSFSSSNFGLLNEALPSLLLQHGSSSHPSQQNLLKGLHDEEQVVNGSNIGPHSSFSPNRSLQNCIDSPRPVKQVPNVISANAPGSARNPSVFKIKEPRVMLNRLKPEDEALMQKSLKEFAQNKPDLANKLGITISVNNSKKPTPGRSKYKEISSSSGSEDETKTNSKFFKSKGREKEALRKRERQEKRSRQHDDDYDLPDFESPSRGRKLNSVDESPRKKIRRIERKLVPVIQKLSTDELMESNTYQRFSQCVDLIFDNTEDLDLNADCDEDADVPSEALIPKYQLQDLYSEAAKLKVVGATQSIPCERLVRLLNILEKNIRDGSKVSPLADPDDDEEETKLWHDIAMERVLRGVDSSLSVLYILTSANMPKRVYLEDVIDRVVLFTKYQLSNTIFPSFDPVYRITSNKAFCPKKKKVHNKEVREKSILLLYNKLNEVVGLLSELLSIQVLTDTAVLNVSSLSVSPFFVESVSELQLSSLKLVTTIFTRYEKHRRLLLDDILASIARLPSNKRSLRSYRLKNQDCIQMLTALVLQLIQCVVVLPDRLHKPSGDVTSLIAQNNETDGLLNESITAVDRDVFVRTRHDLAIQLAGTFLTVFLNKCGNKNEEIDYRPLFENFVQDLLTTVNKPEWPAAELLLSLLGNILVKNFMNKGIEIALRVASLDYLGVVAARLRKDAVSSNLKVDTINKLINEIKEEERKDSDDSGSKHDLKSKKCDNISSMQEEEERCQYLQKVLLDFLAVSGQGDQSYNYARHFYIVLWFKGAGDEISRHFDIALKNNRKVKKKKSKKHKESEDDDLDEDSDQKEEQENAEVTYLVEERKGFLMSKVKPFEDHGSGKTQILQTYIDYESAELICRYLASKRPFSFSFDVYLMQILKVLNENSIAIRTKAMKCLTMIVEADPAILGRTNMQLGVQHSFLDHSTSVREAAVDLVGKFVLSCPKLIDKYYEMLSQRILDTGVSVRKRVIKIMKDICIECPEFPKIPEICIKMIRRVNDEEGIRKLVMEVFQNMWFTPVKEKPHLDNAALLRKVLNITEVVYLCKDTGLDWFEQLLQSLFKPKEDKEDSAKVQMQPPAPLLTACRQIVQCLIENVLRLEETTFESMSETMTPKEALSQRLVACLTTLYLLAKIRPQLLIDHATTLQPYLSLKCKSPSDFQIISCVARTLELVVPLIEHPSESFMAQLEEDSVKLILQHEKSVVASCLSCLGSVVNSVTKNFKLIRDCFKNYYGTISSYKQLHLKDRNDPRLAQHKAYFKRALFTVGLLMRHFDFTIPEVNEGLPTDIKDQVFQSFFYFLQNGNFDVQYFTLQAIGSMCIRHYDYMLMSELKRMYHLLLTDKDAHIAMRIQVLGNIETYLQEEEMRMIKQDQEWAKMSKKENLKEMGDVSSGMASTVIQIYLKDVLDAFLHPNVTVRKAALRVIQLILQQGLVHPVQIVPYLICMSTDLEQCVSHSADKQLQEIEKKYPGFIHMKTLDGIWLSFRLQEIIQNDEIVRGFRTKEKELPTALNGFLYSILRNTKQQRRAVSLSILKQFDEQAKTSLSQMLYLADNLAYCPYQVIDEPLFIIHHIDIVLSLVGTNLLQSFRESLNLSKPAGELGPDEEHVIDEDDEDDVEELIKRISEDTKPLLDCITASQGCMLLLVLKQHLKDLYGISDSKLTQYAPTESGKIYEKSLTRKTNSIFDPKATLQKLKEGTLPGLLTNEDKREVINQYLSFKQLMLSFDGKDGEEEDEDEGSKVTKVYAISKAAPDESACASAQGPDGQQAQFPKIPKLTIVPVKMPNEGTGKSYKSHHKVHKVEKHRKHKHKKKKRVVSNEDEDDEDEYSDPDFLG
ncbi:nipped-B-like protein isoform X2 [Neocloeon triangulifer]|uniref:nipped-B-like protein isoform X2 n=1 Tax=Neocloeon triangulifer TaxID=2078957 RepID=UPI00286F9EB3|nr:nipped-B-like protein isoform X2 [Neocloeon triangulifer]